jgi:uncharacterized membrane protein YsdA (DUF1294 family)
MTTSLIFLIILVLIILNLSVMFLYRHDKIRAMKGGRRTPESTLLWAALIAPFGAAYGMRLFRHKTRHRKFLLVYVFMVLHLAIIAYLVYTMI